MTYTVVWLLVAALLGLWSLGIWALQAVGAWAVVQTGAVGVAATGDGPVAWPLWLQSALPREWLQLAQPIWATLVQAMQWLFELAPSLAAGLTGLAWGVWAVGALLLVLLGASIHVGTAWWRRARPAGSGAMRRPVISARHTA